MKLIILGAGGYGRTIADIAGQSGRYDEICFLDDNSTNNQVVGKCSDFAKYVGEDIEMYPAFGNNQSRIQWIEKLLATGISVPSLIHPTAYISTTVMFGIGTVVLPKAVINTDCTIGNGCIINCGAIVDHGCVLEDGVHICLGAIVKGENRIQYGKKIEAGEVIPLGTYPV